MKKKILVISNGPVPPMIDYKIEGGGMRAWGLATGLASRGYDLTVAVRNTYPVAGVDSNLKLVNWKPGKALTDLANKYDVVIISYSTGKIASYLANHIKDSIIFVLDCYVPIYIEISARNSKNPIEEYINYFRVQPHFNKTLKRGDYFLCANEPQKHFYIGVLSALGIINPFTYQQDRLLIVPFGIDDRPLPPKPANPYVSLGITEGNFVLLWFGGLYPWFDMTPLLQAVHELTAKNASIYFVVVGAKNPYNQNPDFNKRYEEALGFVQKNNLSKAVKFVDWVNYDERINWYAHAGAVISLNSPGQESAYSWRTRVMDYVWAKVPILTNGGDPLSEELLANEAAIRIKSLDNNSISSAISYAMQGSVDDYTNNLSVLRKKYFWNNLVEPLAHSLDSQAVPFSDTKAFASKAKKSLIHPQRVSRALARRFMRRKAKN